MDFLKIQTLIKHNDLKTAKELISQATYRDKQSKQFQKIQKLYNLKATELRRVFVKNNINKVNSYLKHNQYNEAYHLITDLENIDSNNRTIQNLKAKVISKLNKQLQSTSKKLLETSQKEISKLIQNNQDQEALDLTYNLQSLPDTLRKQLEIETKRKIIDKKLQSNKSSLKNTPTPQKYDFIKNLYDLEPNYPKIQKLLLDVRNELQSYSKVQKKNLIKDLELETKILFNKKQYQKTKETTKRILSIDPNNNKAIKYYKKADHCYYTDSYDKAYKILQSKTSK